MIKNIIFDFGDVFINLDKPATVNRLTEINGKFTVSDKMDQMNKFYEKGLVSTSEFVSFYMSIFPKISKNTLIDAWNAIILDLPENRIEFLEKLSKENNYRLFLLSNTNALHIDHVIKNIGAERFNRFKNCFEQFYLSHEINFRKPDLDIYKFVLNENNLKPEETLFIDDVEENTTAAASLNIITWNLKPGVDEVTTLLEQTFLL
ncbi:HAD family hydrolase [Zhouia amylolytica]|uniref:Haloacid dehalogenase domain-containing protein hydrolase n=1 Tax=Zhouia amylolytica AD3 TaxID=1286632 RepID=W2UQQ0_9FLAO|nr:HAD family phosphatase [Zhouia amylolytica]ETN95657.1 haloacid dehalogenase domain-containing protein hydrolase [Zhouia amylolytica AD3]